MVLIWSTSEVWKAESNLYPPSGCELGTSGKETEPPQTTTRLLHNSFRMLFM